MADFNRATVVADDREDFDRLTLIRLGVWGLSAFFSIIMVVVAAQSDVGVKRAAAAVAAITSPPRDPASIGVQQVLARTAESDREMRRLSELVRSLSSERDRLGTRVDSVEREVGDLTGSITKSIAQQVQQQQARMAPPEKAPAPAPVAPPAAIPPAPAISAPQTVPPQPIAPMAAPSVAPSAPVAPKPSTAVPAVPTATLMSSVSVAAVAPATVDPRTARPFWPNFMPPATVPSIDSNAPVEEAPVSNTPEQAEVIPLPRPSPLAQLRAYGFTATQGDPANPPQPAERVADASPATTSSIAKADPADPGESNEQPKVEIGVDLGPGLSIARLRTRWEAFRKAQGAALVGVRPVVSIRETSANKPVELRLVVGPLSGIDVAVQLCQSLSGSQFPCQPAVFDGQRLVLR